MTKNILLLATVFSLSLSMLYAQQKPAPQKSNPKNERMEKQDSIWQQLNLTADQQTQIKKIKHNAHIETAKIKSNNAIQPQEKKEQLRSIRKKAQKAVNEILTPEQKEKLRSLRQHEMLEKTAKELGLTEEQKNQLFEVQNDFHKELGDLQEKMKEAKKEFTEKVKSFLSEEQFKQYMERMKKKMEPHRPPMN